MITLFLCAVCAYGGWLAHKYLPDMATAYLLWRDMRAEIKKARSKLP